MKRFALALPLLFAGCLMYEEREVIPARNPVSIGEIVQMRAEGASDDAMLGEIYANGVGHHPTADDVVWMKKAGLSDTVVQAMINAPMGIRRPEQVVVRRSYYRDEGVDDALIFGLGALVGWTLGHPYSHRHYGGCGHGRW
jgi:hypothetical protein